MAGRGRYDVRFAFALAALIAGASLASPILARQAPAATAPAAAPAHALTLEQKEAFLKNAKIVRTRGASKGVTNTLRATLSDGVLTHDASIQTIDEQMREFRGNRGTELNFVDSWRYNVAAYRLGRLLDLDMIPPSIERRYDGKIGAFTWWVDEVLMDEGERLKTKQQSPHALQWNQQMWIVRLFDQLIANTDRNLGNLLIDKSWKIWMIDHSRAFRLNDKMRAPENLSKVDRTTFERLKALELKMLQAEMKTYLTPGEIRSMLARRDEIVARFERIGETSFFDRPAQGW